ncbi:MAG: ketopantoate reductase family protein [Desulfobacterales bacterium]|nr:ketopantoate reductase family protein [Desulfobacterales bacterium]
MEIVIVGAGAIGRVFGALLSRGGHRVWFVETREDVVEAINRNGIEIMDIGVEDPGAMTRVPARAVNNGQEIKQCDLVILAVKSFDTRAAVKGVAHLVAEDSPVLSLQTGLGNLEIMEKVVGRDNIIGGFTFMAGIGLGPGRVKHSGLGDTLIGELTGQPTPRIERLSQVLTRSGIPTEVTREVKEKLWCKVIVYSAINSVSAVLRMRNGMLLQNMESITLMKRLVDEGRAVAEACDIDIRQDLYELLFDICNRTAANMSSMLQDVVNRKRTEVDALNGMLCAYGTEQRVATPTQQTMVQLVKLVEKWDQCYIVDT